MRKKRRKLILFCSLLLATTPAYAENATEAVSISDTASVVELTSDANMETEMQSVSESDTSETYAQEMDQVTLPAIWQETYTYLAATQDTHAFPEKIEKSGDSIIRNGIEYFILPNTENVKASWQNGQYACVISGQLTTEELEKIIESIQ